MTELAPPQELVVLIAPAWTPKPKFHAYEWRFSNDDMPPGIATRLDADAPWRFTAVLTRCGILLRGHWWLEPHDHGPPEHSGTFTHPSTTADLRYEHARLFAAPCRRCWPSPPPRT